MSNHIGLSPQLTDYILRHTKEDGVAKRLREETLKMPTARMITTPDQVQFLAFLIQIMNARRVIEVGTFTGYATLAMAQALPEGGSIIACDVSKEYTNIAKRYWREAGVEDRIDLRIGQAEKTLAELIEGKNVNIFDMVFIDADKGGYDRYYEASLKLLRPGGIIAFDNMLWEGAVADMSDMDRDTVALRDLNAKIAADSRVDSVLLTVADGVMLARKR